MKHTDLYYCPMHPEVTSDKPDRCPKCEMKLVKRGDASSHTMSTNEEKVTWKSYLPLIIIIGIILLTSLSVASRSSGGGESSFLTNTIEYFMIGFFLVFSSFKLMDLKGFADGYSTYDLLAKRWETYGYIYPFIELAFGLGMILMNTSWLLWLEIVVMAFSGVGVVLKLLRREKFQCACLGTFLKVPLTKVTVIEDFGMALLAALLLILR